MDTSEKRFEQDIESFMISQGGYEQFSYQDKNKKWIYKEKYSVIRAIYLDVLVRFIEKTQPKEWARYVKHYKDDAPAKLYRRLEELINEKGLIYVLKNGVEDVGIKLKICYFKPESELNQKDTNLYNENILGVTRQFAYSQSNHNTIDMVLTLNGIPIVALELKNQLKGQDYECAINQYKNDRDPKEFCFKFNHRFLVYFAVDLYECWMTTELKGEHTKFLPFNQGSNGAGKVGGKGNPQNKDNYSTSYLWQEVLKRDSLLDLINRFICYVEEKKEYEVNGIPQTRIEKKIIFPRYHQYDVVKKVIADVKAKGAGVNYLIEHSAGSGKSNSIAWIAYRLASLHNDNNEPIFNSVIVVTNRAVLDSQLQDTINSFDHVAGLVEAIDENKGSKGLVEAINDKKRIIICTIQKFLYAYNDFDSLSGRNFAIIVDEAHQGQSGESAKTLRKALIDKKVALKEYANEEDAEEINEGEVLDEILSQGKHKNQSFFAFTATPRNKTLEVFGTINPTNGKKEPFHIYSMRQAIEEGFILDVLQNYTTIQEAFKLAKISKDNPELIKGQAFKTLVRYYKEHGFTIKQKTDIIMSNFTENGMYKINGKGKAMIIADSRRNAVRYYRATKDWIKANPQKSNGCNALVAFTGAVKFDDEPGVEYTEANLNVTADGKPINTDKKFRKEFESDRYNILIVANKYQTGFDEPQLHSMYVDKELNGINAVQTLSRLNRTARYKSDTFVLDFVNSAEDIKTSFQPFYEGISLVGDTDYNAVYDLRAKLKEFMLYNSSDIDSFNKLMKSQSGSKQDSTGLGRLTSLLKPIVDRYNYLNKDDKYKFRDYTSKFNKNYSYITQLIRIHDEELFKEYQLTSYLVMLLPKDKREFIDINDKINLEYVQLKETFSGQIILDKQSIEVKPDEVADVKKVEKKKDTLESIIENVNEKYNGDFTEEDKVVIDNVLNIFLNDSELPKYKEFARNNNSEMFEKSIFPQKFKDIVTKCYIENNKSFGKLIRDLEFYNNVMQEMAKSLYKSLRM